MPTVVKTAGWLLQSLHAGSSVLSVGDGVEVPGNPWFRYHHCDAWSLAAGMHEVYEGSPVLPPVPDWSAWNGTDRVYEFLNSIDDYPYWAPTSGTSGVMGYATRPAAALSGPMELFTCIVPDWMLPWVSGQMAGGSPIDYSMIPPIWPGADLVTMGEIVSLGLSWSIEGPLNGVLVSISSVPAWQAQYDWGVYVQYPRAGYVSFLSDAGCFEDPQPVTFDAHIVCPKLCRSATRVIGRCKPGIEGSAQAWAYSVP